MPTGTLDIRMFGAVGGNDETKDVQNVAAINACIAQLDTLKGGEIYIPPDEFCVSGTILGGAYPKRIYGSPPFSGGTNAPFGDLGWSQTRFSGSSLRWTNPVDGIQFTQNYITNSVEQLALIGYSFGCVTVGWTQPAAGFSANLTVLASTVYKLTVRYNMIGQSIWIDGFSTPLVSGSTISYAGGRYILNSAAGTTINVTNAGDVYNAPAGATMNVVGSGAGIGLLNRGLSSVCDVAFANTKGVFICNFWEGFNPGGDENFRHQTLAAAGNSVGIMIDGKSSSMPRTIANPFTTMPSGFTQPAIGSSVGPLTVVNASLITSGAVCLMTSSGMLAGMYSCVVNSGTTITLTLKNARYSIGPGLPVPAGCNVGYQNMPTDASFTHSQLQANGDGFVLEGCQATGHDGGLIQGNSRTALLVVGGGASPLNFGGDIATWFEANGQQTNPGAGPSIACDMTGGGIATLNLVNLHQGGDQIGFLCVNAGAQQITLNMDRCGFGGSVVIPVGANGGASLCSFNSSSYVNNSLDFYTFACLGTGQGYRVVKYDNISTVGAGTTNALNTQMGVTGTGRHSGYYDVIATGHTAAGDVCVIQARQPFVYVASTMHFGTPITLSANSGAGPSGASTVITGSVLTFIGVGGPGICCSLTGVAGQTITWFVEATGFFNPN